MLLTDQRAGVDLDAEGAYMTVRADGPDADASGTHDTVMRATRAAQG